MRYVSSRNLVHRSRDQRLEVVVDLPPHLVLKQEPVADCRRYDQLLKGGSILEAD
jgi:hypothetical protein